MDDSLEVSAEQEIAQVTMGRPHVVLLGAGASRAAFPNGERHGKILPLMADFAEVLPVNEIFAEEGVKPGPGEFEENYAKIASDPLLTRLQLRLEELVYDYFDGLRLPQEPTLYDFLLLSLRPKDVIATFNWDPFLIQAARRNWVLEGKLPNILFLHGNVLSGYCNKDNVHGVKGLSCSHCGQPFEASRLLYPIAQKDYSSDPMIADAWRALEKALKNAFMLTIFGYSAPASDKEAVALLKQGWGLGEARNLEQVEIIDIRGQEELRTEWAPFIHTHHYEIHSTLTDSWLWNHPRRTGEAYWNQYMEAKFIANNPIPYLSSLPELWDWFAPLLSVEADAHQEPADV